MEWTTEQLIENPYMIGYDFKEKNMIKNQKMTETDLRIIRNGIMLKIRQCENVAGNCITTSENIRKNYEIIIQKNKKKEFKNIEQNNVDGLLAHASEIIEELRVMCNSKNADITEYRNQIAYINLIESIC